MTTRRSHRRSTLLAAAATLALGLALAIGPAPASAGTNQISVMMDDDLLLYGTDANRRATLFSMKLAGVDAVRVTVLWKVVAPRKRRKGWDPRDPSHYHSGILDRYDRLVREALDRGVLPYLNVTWPGPKWAHARTDSKRLTRLGTHRPRRHEFAKFVEMLGKRYSGTYHDENDGKRVLPAVRVWSIGNEPNQGGWLTPQWTTAGKGRKARKIPASPHLYRELFRSATRSLKKTGHGAPTDVVMFGELAPIGRSDRRSTSPIHPGRFLREMACLDSNYRPFRGASAKMRHCTKRDRKMLETSAIAYHPYTKNKSPERRPRHRDEITLGNIKTLPRMLDRIAKRSKMLPSGLRIWLTEFGYETDPPDKFNGVRPDRQAQWINIGDFLAYRQSRVDAQTQFLLADSQPFKRFKKNSRPYWLTYQSGLFFQNGTPKPSWTAYMMPIHVQHLGANVNVWGQIRFRPNKPPHSVEVQFKAQGSNVWQPQRVVTTNNPRGFFEERFAVPATGVFRTVWRDQSGAIRVTSREVFIKK